MSDDIVVKHCSRCNKTKPVSEFHRLKSRYYQSWCKQCRLEHKKTPAERAKLSERRKRPEYRAKEREYRRRPHVRAKEREYSRRPEVKQRHDIIAHRSKLKRYGLTVEEYDALLKQQNGRCAICNKKFPKNRRPHVDHDHRTGKVRGLLCTSHNHGLGMFNDDEELLLRAVEYLRRFRQSIE